MYSTQQKPLKGRGAATNRSSRYLPHQVYLDADQAGADSIVTECRPETAKSIIATNQSPDVPFDHSINPYRGCEHGCVYCYARPSHAWLDLSPGLDFETRLTYKHNAVEKLEETFRKPGYQCKPITLGANTDAYQPIEAQHALSRGILQLCLKFRHPVAVITKGSLIERDIDILKQVAEMNLASVAISITTLDKVLKRNMEPRAAAISTRLQLVEKLSKAGVPVTILVSPMIPGLNDKDMECILELSASAGARSASYMLLRLPLEIKDLFHEWLHAHYPLRAQHVISLMRQCRAGADYDARFGHRMRGTGPFADLLAARFKKACRQYGLNLGEHGAHNTSLFTVPATGGDQLKLF